MALEFDQMTGKILYQGKEVGTCTSKDGRSVVHIDITYECSASEDWAVPLSHFSHGLNKLASNQMDVSPADLVIETSEDSLTGQRSVPRFLTEKEIKAGSYVWSFHKTDADNWPSALHGHEYEHRLKLDVLTGRIYDVVTRQHYASLKKKDLETVRDELRKAKDFSEKARALLG
jgi:hypothetical protein